MLIPIMELPTRIIGRTRRLTTPNRRIFDEIFESDGGWVLDFSIRTMAEWFEEVIGIQIFKEEYQLEGDSKGKTLRGFVEIADGALVDLSLRELWAYRKTTNTAANCEKGREIYLKSWLDQFCTELAKLSDNDVTNALSDFSNDETVPLLRANIQRDLIDGNPQVAIDRIHTFSVKRLRHALSAQNKPYDNGTPLHSLFGAYVQGVTECDNLKGFMLDAMRGQYRVLEAMNTARNKFSFAHDNPLLDETEARYLTQSVLATLSYIDSIEATKCKIIP
ncbi:MAG: hypothetical protein JKY25_10320 [Robiginitomaculum sp.]|nr:hypothetical protein [Robiginitomaculum sp.]